MALTKYACQDYNRATFVVRHIKIRGIPRIQDMAIGKGTPPEAFIENLKAVAELGAGDSSTQTPSEGLIGNAVKTACKGWSTSPTSDIPFGTGWAFMQELCTPYFNSIGADPPTSAVLFTGGQCPGVSYRIGFTGTRGDNGNPTSYYRDFIEGPITLFRIDRRPYFGETGLYLVWEAANGAGDIFTGLFEGCSGASCVNGVSASVLRMDGAPDTCGNPPGVVTPGTAPVYNYGDIDTYVDNSGNTYNVTVNPPKITLDGGLELEAEVGDVAVDLFGGGANSDPQPVTPGPGTPEGEPRPVTPEDGDEDVIPEGTLRGIQVTITDVPDTPRVEFGNPNPLFYNFGWVAFGNSAGYGSYDRIIAENQYFWAPRGSDRYRVKVNPFTSAIVQTFVEED